MPTNDRYLSRKSSASLKSTDGSTELVPITQPFFTQFSEINSNASGKVLAPVIAVINPDGTAIGGGGGGSSYPASTARTPNITSVTNVTSSTPSTFRTVSFFVKSGAATVLGYLLNTGEAITFTAQNNDTLVPINYIVDSLSTLIISSVS